VSVQTFVIIYSMDWIF